MGGIVRNPGVPTTRQVIAGANMTGGGPLTGDVTLNGTGGAGGALVLIEERVLAGTSASETFNQAALANYRNLRVVIAGRGDKNATNMDVYLQLNGDTGANYDHEIITGSASATAAAGAVAATQIRLGTLPALTAPANSGGSVDAVIYNSKGAVFWKSVRAQYACDISGATSGQVVGGSIGHWRNQAAVISFLVKPDTGNFIPDTIISVYGFN